jgi:hypothetical protein
MDPLRKNIATFILDYQQQCGKGKHPVQEIKNQIKIAYSEADTQAPSQIRMNKIRTLENKLHKTMYTQKKSATTAANKAAQSEGQTKQFYKKYRPSLKAGGIATPPPTGMTLKQRETPRTKQKTCAKRLPIVNYYIWLFQEKQAQEPEPLLEKLREKRLSDIDKTRLDQKSQNKTAN